MDATTTPSTTSLIAKLTCDFPAITFTSGDIFRWSPGEHTIYYAHPTDAASLLHEVAHMALGHAEYVFDIELLQMERDAWAHTINTLAPHYGIPLQEEQIDALLDTYRDWLHDRSLCPTCKATGIQTAIRRYNCLTCHTSWKVNEARTCSLRRYKLK